MCCDLLLCKTTNGKAYQSTCDGSFVIIFNNVVLQLSEESLLTLLSSVRTCLEENPPCSCDDERHFVFHTSSPRVLLSFSRIELKELNYLLETSIVETLEEYAP